MHFCMFVVFGTKSGSQLIQLAGSDSINHQVEFIVLRMGWHVFQKLVKFFFFFFVFM